MAVTCPSCGSEVPAVARFCMNCGAALTPAAPERWKLATLVFCDLSGSTAMGERLDAEAVRTLMLSYFHEMRGALERHGGTVEKFVGDAVLAVFGVPEAHEDDALRACRAALEMQARLGTLNEELEQRFGTRIALRIGVNTGEVVAGDASTRETFVTGDTVNTTSRLLGAAAPGTILVSASTHALTQHRFAFDAAEAVALKGKAEPVVVHRLSGALAAPQSARGLARYGLASRLVGRDRELDQLLAAFVRMEARRAQVVSVSGEAGSGKSRLLAEFMASLEGNGRLARPTVRRATCSSLGEVPYGVFAALFREGYRIDLARVLQGVAQITLRDIDTLECGKVFGLERRAAGHQLVLVNAIAMDVAHERCAVVLSRVCAALIDLDT